MSIRKWEIVRGDRAVSRHFTQRGAAAKMRRIKKKLQKCSDRLSLTPEYDHFRAIIAEMIDNMRIARAGE